MGMAVSRLGVTGITTKLEFSLFDETELGVKQYCVSVTVDSINKRQVLNSVEDWSREKGNGF